MQSTISVSESPVIVWRPQPGPQSALVSSPVYEVFFGGARGGGKTDSFLGEFCVHAQKYGRHANGAFFRRRFKQLEEVIRRSHQIYSPLGAIYIKSRQQWEFPNGAVLKFRHLWDVDAAEEYQGHAYTRIYVEEATHWPSSDPINRLRGSLRSAASVPVGIRLNGNPGGPGHNWVKSRYIDPAPAGYRIISDQESGLKRVFIPALPEDNIVLMENDPTYLNRLSEIGNQALVKAWRYGIWDIVAGGFFDDIWSPSRHVIKAFSVPNNWRRFRSFDWGSSRPFSLGIWAVSPGETLEFGHFPGGSLIRIGEWYGAQRDRSGAIIPNVGLRMPNTEMGRKIAVYSRLYAPDSAWRGDVADPSIFAEEGGPSIFRQMRDGCTQANSHPLNLIPADNTRITGWHQMRDLMSEALKDRPERPILKVFDTCTEFIRTVPPLQMDQHRPDDVDTDSEDHVADESRYACMSNRRTGMAVDRMYG